MLSAAQEVCRYVCMYVWSCLKPCPHYTNKHYTKSKGYMETWLYRNMVRELEKHGHGDIYIERERDMVREI